VKVRFAELIAPQQFEIREEDLNVSKEEVLVKISACGICYSDLCRFEGKRGKFPQRPGHEPTGVVEEVGREVKDFKEGDRVTGLFSPAFATYAVAGPKNLVKIPDGVATEHALGEPLKCCVTCIRAAHPEFGDYVVLVGCGPMGLTILAGIARCPAAEIIAVDPIDTRLTLAKELGATVVINPTKSDTEDVINRITKERGIDVAIEATGTPAGLELTSKVLRTGRAKLILVSYHYLPKEYNLSYWGIKGPIIHSTHPSYCLEQMDDWVKKENFPHGKNHNP